MTKCIPRAAAYSGGRKPLPITSASFKATGPNREAPRTICSGGVYKAVLYAAPADSPQEKRRRSAAVSRKLRMLRAHGIIHKVPHTHRYVVAPQARTTLVAILTSARTSLNQINELQRRAA